jgi:hypothetical protein
MKTNQLVKSLVSFFVLAVVFAPVLVFAQGIQVSTTPPTAPSDIGTLMSSIANKVWLVFAGIAIIMFLVAGILFLTANGSPEKIGQARQAVIWGIIGIVVGILAGGIVSFVGTLSQ